MGDDEAKVLKFMKNAGEPLRPGDIAEGTGIDKKEVSKIIQGLKKVGKVDSPKRCFWAPTK